MQKRIALDRGEKRNIVGGLCAGRDNVPKKVSTTLHMESEFFFHILSANVANSSLCLLYQILHYVVQFLIEQRTCFQ